MRTERVLGAALMMALLGSSATAFAQDAGVGSDAAMGVVTAGDAAVAAVPQGLPPGHPSIGAQPQQAPPLQATGPESFADEDPSVPVGEIQVRVVNPRGEPQPGISVRVGTMHDGEPGPSQNVLTDAQGVAHATHLEINGNTAYRVSVENDGARFGAEPFQLSPVMGTRVQVVRFDVDHNSRAVLLWDARVEIHFKDDRLIVVERLYLVNLSAMSFGGGPAHPVAWSPPDGVRFAIPEDHTAFNVAPSMADLRVTEEGNFAVLRGSLPPTGTEPVEVDFQYHVKLSGGDIDLRLGLGMPLVSTTIVTEAPRGLTLSVDGMPAAESQTSNGQQVLLTGLERRPNDPAVSELRIHLGGIPAAAGPWRAVASVVSGLLVLGALAGGIARRRRPLEKRSKAEVEAERDRVLEEARELARMHKSGEVGPVNFQKRRRELALWLAALLKEQSE